MIAIIDCESTGTPKDPNACIVELAAVALDPHADYAEVDWWASVVLPSTFDERAYPSNPSQRVPVEAILGARGEADALRSFQAWMKQHRVTEVFSYNRVFDETMLKRSGFELPWTGCVMRMARKAMPERTKDPSLNEAFFQYCSLPARGVAGPDHRALPDARKAAEVFRVLRRKGG